MSANHRRIIRAVRTVLEASDLLDEIATQVFECETIDGGWPETANEALAYHDKCRAIAKALRQMITPVKAGDHG